MKVMANAKAAGRDDLPKDLLERELQRDQTIALDFRRLITLSWHY